ncbi:MAG TPA: hypothetical protein VHO03_04460 [Ignavibacteriales bacterium]|nr:hypothetical protein [Ignavibacteriales bacterium]
MTYEEMYLNLYIGLSIVLTFFGVVMVFLALRKSNPREARRANILPLISGIPEDEKEGSLKGLNEEKNDTLSDT